VKLPRKLVSVNNPPVAETGMGKLVSKASDGARLEILWVTAHMTQVDFSMGHERECPFN
jgi:hypothetical protein